MTERFPGKAADWHLAIRRILVDYAATQDARDYDGYAGGAEKK